ncbi:LytR/AlgR family response regulator transcription factor [Olsenella profusa]|uniref:Response regulator transcription factor n=1 Tax=Olsenella profusa TaxID=138595 RepID=A0ABS2F0Q7_9ACTN|nr:LytTR family DNA-binding domain-containing protein [Olsenella profusa]MBM6774564.1 response regulator transcription factor [Olsenella profusa]
MYRTLIVEDEPDEASRLTEYVHRYGKAHGEQFQITWLKSAMDMLSDKSHYDLVLLDIDLPGINGMEAAQLMRVYDEETPIIFVTNLAKYAVKGYEVGATGFIIKPVNWGNLSMNLDRALRAIKKSSGRSVIVPTEEGMRVVPLSAIVYVEVTGHRLSYHLESGEVIETRGSLSQVEEELAGAPVIRIAKSCLANMDKIQILRPQSLQMVTGEQLSISRTRKCEVTDAVTDYLGGRR